MKPSEAPGFGFSAAEAEQLKAHELKSGHTFNCYYSQDKMQNTILNLLTLCFSDRKRYQVF